MMLSWVFKKWPQTPEHLRANTELYRSDQNLLPPSESLPRVLLFELTQGCSWGRCTYCCGFDGQRYEARSADEFKSHVDAIIRRIRPGSDLAYRFKRVFIGGGNALAIDSIELAKAVEIAIEGFSMLTPDRYNPRRVATYGRTADFNKHGVDGLARLTDAGLDLVYWGVESGSDAVLKSVMKGDSKKLISKAAQILERSTLRTSVMIMPGLGGYANYDSHVGDTAEVLSMIQPDYVTFLGINPKGTRYDTLMRNEVEAGTNRPLTRKETAQQMIDIIGRTRFSSRIKLGCFDTNVDKVGLNPLAFGSVEVDCDYLRDRFVLQQRKVLDLAYSA